MVSSRGHRKTKIYIQSYTHFSENNFKKPGAHPWFKIVTTRLDYFKLTLVAVMNYPGKVLFSTHNTFSLSRQGVPLVVMYTDVHSYLCPAITYTKYTCVQKNFYKHLVLHHAISRFTRLFLLWWSEVVITQVYVLIVWFVYVVCAFWMF